MLFAVIVLLGLTASQTVTGQTQTPSADEIVAQAAKQVPLYLETFRNLVSQETKTLERIGKDGDVKHPRRVVSIFLVYQSTRDERSITEYRNVVEVDGKRVGKSEERAKSFFDRVQKAQDSVTELRRIEQESSRFDGELSVSGMTLFQGVALFDHIRPSIEFRLRGEETVDGAQVYVLDYRQTRPSPYITTDARLVPNDGKTPIIYELEKDAGPMGGRLRGTLWIDTASLQIRREVREFTVQPSEGSPPIVAAKNQFEYGPSEFGILTPRRIVVSSYRVDAKNGSSREDDRVTMEYDRFSRPDVEIRSSEIKSPGN